MEFRRVLFRSAMLDAVNAGETAQQVQNAISLIAILAEKATTEAALVEEALSGADYFQSLRTEAQFLGRNRAGDARRVISDLIRERVLKRHLWVASRKRSEEHTSELQSLMRISYAVFCL